MTDTTIQLIAAFGLFVLGIAVGILLQKKTANDARRVTRLQQKLTETEDRFTRYQADVTSHFMDTARKVQTLNKTYREVNEQLASGARKLCEGGDVEELISLNFNTQANPSHRGHTIEVPESGVTPPMDYAPKDAPEKGGTLSEGFGFEGDKLKEFDEQLEKEYKQK